MVPSDSGPIWVPLEKDEVYYWCRCGKSGNQPFCDGSHQGSGMEPMAYKARSTRKLKFCGCKATKKPPFCDGSHEDL